MDLPNNAPNGDKPYENPPPGQIPSRKETKNEQKWQI